MIALPDRLPLVSHDAGYTTTFNRQWVDNSLRAAARAAGYEKWWLSGHVAQGVHNYLDEHHQGTVITTIEVEQAIQMILEGIGYDEVAREVRLAPPPVEVALPVLAEQASFGYELVFFQLLDKEISRLLDQGVQNIRFTGMRYAIKLLDDAKRWNKGCKTLRAEILVFLNNRLINFSAGRQIAYTVA